MCITTRYAPMSLSESKQSSKLYVEATKEQRMTKEKKNNVFRWLTFIALVAILCTTLVGCSYPSQSSSSSQKSGGYPASSSQYLSIEDIKTSFPELYSYAGFNKIGHNEDKVISYKDAGNYIGQDVTVEGSLTSVYNASSSKGSPLFFNLGNNQFCAVVWEENQSQLDWGYIDLLLDWSMSDEPMAVPVRVSGTVSSYNGEPQIVVRDACQLSYFYDEEWSSFMGNENFQKMSRQKLGR